MLLKKIPEFFEHFYCTEIESQGSIVNATLQGLQDLQCRFLPRICQWEIVLMGINFLNVYVNSHENKPVRQSWQKVSWTGSFGHHRLTACFLHSRRPWPFFHLFHLLAFLNHQSVLWTNIELGIRPLFHCLDWIHGDPAFGTLWFPACVLRLGSTFFSYLNSIRRILFYFWAAPVFPFEPLFSICWWRQNSFDGIWVDVDTSWSVKHQ